MRFKKLFFIIVILLFAYPALATTYWVDDNGTKTTNTDCDGTDPISGTDACTINAANGFVAHGDTVYLRAGTYYVDGTKEGIYPRASGTAAENDRITYATYSNEVVEFVGTVYNAKGIQIVDHDYITVTGYDGSTAAMNMKFSNMYQFVVIQSASSTGGAGSDYNEISYCEFTTSFQNSLSEWKASTNYTINDYVRAATENEYVYKVTTDNGSSGSSEPTWGSTTNDGNLVWTRYPGIGVYRGSTIYRNSQYNWIHHCSFSNYGYYSTSSDGGALFELGNEASGGLDNTSYNVIENNKFFHGGHHTLGLHNKYNVVRNNHFHNEQWWNDGTGQLYGYRNLYVAGETGSQYHGYNLIEGNRISHGSGNLIPTNLGGGGISLNQSNVIIRYNDFYANGLGGLYIQCGVGEECNANHIYNNTWLSNGFLGQYDIPYDANDTKRRPIVMWDASSAGNSFPAQFMDNVIKNNLFWKNKGGPESLDQIYTNVTGSWGGCAGFTVCGNTIIANNYNPTGDENNPEFTSEGSYGSPSIGTTKEWYLDAADETSTTDPDLTLKSISKAIEHGTYLTTTLGTGSTSSDLYVANSGYFQPGWGNGAGGSAVVSADEICVGSSCAKISTIDYDGAGLKTSTTDATTPQNAAFKYLIGSTLYTASANASLNVPNTVIPKNKYGAIAYDIGTDGTIHLIEAGDNATGYANVPTALAGLAAPAENHIRIGEVVVGYICTKVTCKKSNFTFGTDDLTPWSENVYSDGWQYDYLTVLYERVYGAIGYHITLASPLSWSNGDSIYLSKTSDGTTQVLYDSKPDAGAHEYNSDESGDPPSYNVTVSKTGAGCSVTHDGVYSIQTGNTLNVGLTLNNGWKGAWSGTCAATGTDTRICTPAEAECADGCTMVYACEEIKLMPW